MNPYFKLPRAPLFHGRQDYVVSLCVGKRVLHVGCVDAGLLHQRFADRELMHQRLADVALELWGVDVDAHGIEFLRSNGFDNLIVADASEIGSVPELANQSIDVIVASEVIEHLSNPGLFLDSVSSLMTPKTELVVTVPNAFRIRSLFHMLRGVEYVHPDHNYWFSYHTIRVLLQKHCLDVIEMAAYTFHPGGREVPHPTAPALKRKAGDRRIGGRLLAIAARAVFPMAYRITPFWGDGIIAIARVQPPARLGETHSHSGQL